MIHEYIKGYDGTYAQVDNYVDRKKNFKRKAKTLLSKAANVLKRRKRKGMTKSDMENDDNAKRKKKKKVKRYWKTYANKKRKTKS